MSPNPLNGAKWSPQLLPVFARKENGGTYRRLSGHVVLCLGCKVSGTSSPIRQGHSHSRSTPRRGHRATFRRKPAGKLRHSSF